MNRPATQKPPPGSVLPDSAWCWLVVVGNVVIGVTTLGFFRSLPVFFKSLKAEFNIEYATVSSVLGLNSGGMAFGCFFLPFLTNKFGSRWTCFVAGLTLGTANAISSFATSIVVLQICSGFITGCCIGILVFTMLSSSSRYFLKHRAKATGISTIGIPLGTLLLAPIADFLIQEYGWRGALLILSGLILNSSVSALLYVPVVLPEHIPRKKSSIFRTSSSIRKNSSMNGGMTSEVPASFRQNSDVGTTPTVDEVGEISFKNSLKKKVKAVLDYELFKSLSFDIGLLSAIFFYCGYVSTNTFLVPFAGDHVGLPSFQSSTLLSISGAAECFAKIITGFMADVKRVNKCIMIALTCTVSSVFVISMTFCKTYFALAAVSFSYGLTVTAYVGIIAVIFCEIVGPHKIATAVGYHGCLYAVFLGPCLYFMGLLIDATGDATRTLYTCAGLLNLTSLCLLIIYCLQVRKRRIRAKMNEIEESLQFEE